jgi:hypothetical protein
MRWRRHEILPRGTGAEITLFVDDTPEKQALMVPGSMENLTAMMRYQSRLPPLIIRLNYS